MYTNGPLAKCWLKKREENLDSLHTQRPRLTKNYSLIEKAWLGPQSLVLQTGLRPEPKGLKSWSSSFPRVPQKCFGNVFLFLLPICWLMLFVAEWVDLRLEGLIGPRHNIPTHQWRHRQERVFLLILSSSWSPKSCWNLGRICLLAIVHELFW